MSKNAKIESLEKRVSNLETQLTALTKSPIKVDVKVESTFRKIINKIPWLR